MHPWAFSTLTDLPRSWGWEVPFHFSLNPFDHNVWESRFVANVSLTPF